MDIENKRESRAAERFSKAGWVVAATLGLPLLIAPLVPEGIPALPLLAMIVPFITLALLEPQSGESRA